MAGFRLACLRGNAFILAIGMLLTLFVACCREVEEVVGADLDRVDSVEQFFVVGYAASPVAGNGGSVAFVARRAQNGINWPFRLLPGAGNNRTIREFPKEWVPGVGIEPTRSLRIPGF